MDADTRAAGERVVAGESIADALRLDGNAAAGILSEIFVPDLTASRTVCAHCGATRELGALMVYAHGMGTVLRCPSCDGLVLCVARTATQLWVDATGARHIVIPSGAPSS